MCLRRGAQLVTVPESCHFAVAAAAPMETDTRRRRVFTTHPMSRRPLPSDFCSLYVPDILGGEEEERRHVTQSRDKGPVNHRVKDTQISLSPGNP